MRTMQHFERLGGRVQMPWRVDSESCRYFFVKSRQLRFGPWEAWRFRNGSFTLRTSVVVVSVSMRDDQNVLAGRAVVPDACLNADRRDG